MTLLFAASNRRAHFPRSVIRSENRRKRTIGDNFRTRIEFSGVCFCFFILPSRESFIRNPRQASARRFRACTRSNLGRRLGPLFPSGPRRGVRRRDVASIYGPANNERGTANIFYAPVSSPHASYTGALFG